MYKLIFMDYSMPEMDGVETTMAILRLCAEKASLINNAQPYVCCLSAYQDNTYMAKAMKYGM